MEPKQKQHPVVDVTSDGSKVRFCKEQYCIRTWNVRSMNQGKLEVIRQEMARMKVDILGISELKFTGMGEFNSDDHFIYYCGQESLRRNRVTLIVNRRVRNTVLGCNLKNDRMISVLFPRHTIRYHSNPSLCLNQWCWRSGSWMILWRPTRPSRTNTNKRCLIHYRRLECKNRNSRDTWSNRQVWPWSTKWSRAKQSFAKKTQNFARKHTGQSKHPLPTTQETTLHMDITRWSILKSDWLYSLQPKMEKLYIVSKTRLGADHGSDYAPYWKIQT